MFPSSAVSLSVNYVADCDVYRINSSRVLDIHYLDRHFVALLIHNDYESELRSQQNKFATTVHNEYDPLDLVHLRDPACSKWGHQNWIDYAFGAFADRLIRAIRRIRAPVQDAVARSLC